jgi:hypothetical protein
MTDDSLYLGYKKTTGELQGVDKIALSVSTTKQFKEDPMKFYFRKVLKLKEPQSVALAFGSSAHEAVEEFYRLYGRGDRVKASMAAFERSIRRNFSGVEDKTMRINPDDPMNPRGKVPVEVDVDDLLELARAVVEPVLNLLDVGGPYGILEAQRGKVLGVERTLGELARDAGYDYTTMLLYDPRARGGEGGMAKLATSVIGGVPFHGFVDLVAPWHDGTPVIIDHKFVASAVSYYPPRWAKNPHAVDWTMYDPNYCPQTDLQLDVYSYATGIERAGFQFVTKNPQYTQRDGTLHPDWIDERAWLDMANPGAKLPSLVGASPSGDVHYAAVWRPAPQDHPSRPQMYTRQAIMGRTVSAVRAVAEAMTESLILYKAGVEPHIAFPGGDPGDIALKSCPYCAFGTERGGGQCTAVRTRETESAEAYRQAKIEREKLCQSNPDIMERRALWAANRA